MEIASFFSLFGVKLVQLNHGNLGVVCLGSEDATEYLALGEERYASSEHLAGWGGFVVLGMGRKWRENCFGMSLNAWALDMPTSVLRSNSCAIGKGCFGIGTNSCAIN